MTHTRGPWKRDGYDILTTDDFCLAEVFGGVAESIEEGKANANLIASAPDLLTALKSVCVFLTSNPDDHRYCLINAALEEAKAAIAKAEPS